MRWNVELVVGVRVGARRAAPRLSERRPEGRGTRMPDDGYLLFKPREFSRGGRERC